MAPRMLIAAAAAAVAGAAIAGDKVTSLPGWSGALLSDMYSGYLSIPGGKHLHYIFIASQGDPASDPVTMWLNGGPGCSSLEGLFAELGPYHITPDTTTLFANPYTWNIASSLLFLEAPAGVGFSYADTPSGLVHNDTGNALDNLAAIQAFFAGFPEYASNDFYITGESYAGIYVPTTAYAVVQANNAGSNINLKGIMVGNGCLGTEVGICGDDPLANWFDIEQWRGHGLVSVQTYNKAVAACGNFTTAPTAACNRALNDAANEVGHVDIYYIYGPCITNFSAEVAHLAPTATWDDLQAAKQQIEAGYPLTQPLVHAFRRPLTRREIARGVTGPDACIDAGDLTAYLNQPSVVSALHVVTGLPWVVCSGNISYTPTEADERAVIYPTLIEEAKLHVLIFNGEADACVPFTDNEWWTMSMNYTVASPWTAWMSEADWVGGYITKYAPPAGSFAFTTVRGAGHMVPQYEPPAALALFQGYLAGKY